ncbi:undecaprenyl/decaprenyl-phosphate alpha-N-acetylglucosaminyl 1-phosphate transferase [Desulfobacteraceae bacterium SEEP-SAG9]|nr:undecaprenyl/decaprenyl-phosphate alpha-N-acetylglucosaminyl 1-phosphate transferase [Desulfobacteraceae bacterium SEEP-SAG9]
MTTLSTIFILALIISLAVTPLMKRVAQKYNLVDLPDERKVHSTAIPRMGGIAVYIAFFFPFLSFFFFSTTITELLIINKQVIALVVGASLVFGVGLWDDLHKLNPFIKFSIQLISTLIAYWGGMRIYGFVLPWGGGISLGWLSLPMTVFWFLVVINGINLIDGLDGLAAGVTLFVALMLLVLCVTDENFLTAMGFAALSGATLGFLRYNFNPASIFMGDSGSYFLGYMLAALAIMGSVKSQAAVAILIPIIALGVPLLDVLWSPVRRFLLGRRLFSPDKEHLHHRLLALGLSQRLAVWILYGITILMGILSILMVHVSNEQSAMILLLIGAAMILGMRKLGYFEYFAMDKVYGWLKDLTDQAGITHERRSFLNIQMDIGHSTDLTEGWQNVCEALERLGFDMAELSLNLREGRVKGSVGPASWEWTQAAFDKNKDVMKECLLKLELPLLGKNNEKFGTLWLIKDLERDAISQYTLRRVESLRRTIIRFMEKFDPTKNA